MKQHEDRATLELFPYATMTLQELVSSVCDDPGATPREVEMATRLIDLQEELIKLELTS